MSRLVAMVALGLLLATPAFAGAPIYHGLLTVRPGKGKIDLNTGNASFSVRRWDFQETPDSNGMAPDAELVIVAVGEESFRIPAGMLRASRNGKRFIYRSDTDRGVRFLRLVRSGDGTWRVRLSLAGVDLSRLLVLDPPVCMPFAVIVGDDDGFSGVTFDRPKPFPSKLLTIPGFCDDVGPWPWT